jgi:hypothetical protein
LRYISPISRFDINSVRRRIFPIRTNSGLILISSLDRLRVLDLK